jgi:hypothetical protein
MKHSLKLLAAAVVLALPAASFAGPITFDTPTDANITYAKELVTSTTDIKSNGVATALKAVSTKLGFGVSSAQTRYIRIDLTGGTFGSVGQSTLAPVTATTASVATAGLAITKSTGSDILPAAAGSTATSLTLIDGGNSGDNYAVYQLTAGSAGLTANNGFEFQAASLLMADTATPVTVKYGMFETAAAAAQNAASGQLANSPTAVAIAKTDTGIGFEATQGKTAIASVTATTPYTTFLASSAVTTTQAMLASFKTVNKALAPDTSATVTSSSYFGSTVKMKLEGATDLLAFAGTNNVSTIKLKAAPAVGNLSCSGADISTGVIATDNTVSFSGITPAQLETSGTPNSVELCFTASGTKPIAAQAFTMSLDTNKNGLVLGPVAAGQVKRDGLVLRAPFFADAGSYPASINLANMTPSNIKFNVRCLYKGKAEKAGFQDQVLTGAQTKRLYTGTAATGLGCPTYAGTPATAVSAIELIFETNTAGAVNGTVIRENATTGDVSMSDMTGNSNGAALNLNATINTPTPTAPSTGVSTTGTLTGTAQ